MLKHTHTHTLHTHTHTHTHTHNTHTHIHTHTHTHVHTHTLLLCSYNRSADIPTRQRYICLVESVKENGGTVRIFSSLHVSGEHKSLILSNKKKTVHKLNYEWQPFNFNLKNVIMSLDHNIFLAHTELGQLSGVASILRFLLHAWTWGQWCQWPG